MSVQFRSAPGANLSPHRRACYRRGVDRLIALVLPEIARNVPAIILATVAAISLLFNARSLRDRFSAVEEGLKHARGEVSDMRSSLAPLPQAFERLATAERDLVALRQELHDHNLLARAYVTRDEVRQGMQAQGANLHEKLNALARVVDVLKDRSER